MKHQVFLQFKKFMSSTNVFSVGVKSQILVCLPFPDVVAVENYHGPKFVGFHSLVSSIFLYRNLTYYIKKS